MVWTGAGSTGSLTGSAAGYGSFAFTGEGMWRQLTVRLEGGFTALRGRSTFRGLGVLAAGGALALTGESIIVCRGYNLRMMRGVYVLTGLPTACRHDRELIVFAGDFSLSGANSGMSVVRLGGVPGVGTVAWAQAGRIAVDWMS